jgi:hypothetical protein
MSPVKATVLPKSAHPVAQHRQCALDFRAANRRIMNIRGWYNDNLYAPKR